MPGGMDHDRNAQTLIPSLDVRIRASNHEPTLNGHVPVLYHCRVEIWFYCSVDSYRAVLIR